MRLNQIIKAFDSVKPSTEADEKILAEILKFSREYAAKRNNKASVIKLFASVAACFIFVFAAVRIFGFDIAAFRSKFS